MRTLGPQKRKTHFRIPHRTDRCPRMHPQDRADTTLGGSALGGIQHPGGWGDRGRATPANSSGSSVSTRRTPRPGQGLLLEEGTPEDHLDKVFFSFCSGWDRKRPLRCFPGRRCWLAGGTSSSGENLERRRAGGKGDSRREGK